MKRAFNKYFVVSLSLMLILSNFSYATQLMFCEMSGDSNKCECTHNYQPDYPGFSLAQQKNKCCNEETTELSNSNTLLTTNSQQNQEISSLVILFLDYSVFQDYKYNNNILYSPDKSHLPEIDIPIFNSSLLI